jgi:membrane associated rhomboid family serine protease
MTLGWRPCEADSSCHGAGLPWGLNLFTSMFAHGSWAHIIGNMLFLLIFGDNVEALLGRIRFLGFYVLGGLAATALQTGVTFAFGGHGAAEVPNIGASGAIAAVLGAYLLEFPRSRVLTWVAPAFFFTIPALAFLGIWFVEQVYVGGLSLTQPEAGGGVALFAHVGGFVFGAATVRLFALGRARSSAMLAVRR